MLKQNLINEKQILCITSLNYKNYLSKIRIRSKILHQYITQLEYLSYSLENTLVIFGTIQYNLKHSNNILTTKDYLIFLQNKVNEFIKDEDFNYFIYCIELHKGYKVFSNINQPMFSVIDNIKDNLFGYPHIHFIIHKTIVNNNFIVHNNIIINKNKYIYFLYDYFNMFDCNFQIIKQKNFSLKRKILYIFKEYKLNEQKYSNKYNIAIKNNVFLNLFEVINHKFIKFLNFIPININNLWIYDNSLDLYHNVKLFINYYLNYYYLKAYNGILYHKQKYTKYTWIKWGDFNNFFNLLQENNIKLDFLNKYCIKYVNNNYQLFNSINFDNFSHIEYKNKILSLFGGCHNFSHVDEDLDIYCFKYYDIYIRGFGIDDDEIFTPSINYTDMDFYKIFNKDFDEMYRFCQVMGTILCTAKSSKGDALYLYGDPNSGKSLLTEIYFKDLYGIDNIGILNFSNDKYFIEAAINKKVILINEYVHKKHLRSIMLKILDGSLIEYNIRYKSTDKTLINSHSALVSNYTIKEQGFDNAMQSRFKDINFLGDFESKNISFDKIITEFPYITFMYFSAYYSYNNKAIFKEFLNLG